MARIAIIGAGFGPALHHQNSRSVSFRSHCDRSSQLSFIPAATLATSAAIRSQISRGHDLSLCGIQQYCARWEKLSAASQDRQDYRSPSSSGSIFWHRRLQQLSILSLRREEVNREGLVPELFVR
jgi:hypothetical protein